MEISKNNTYITWDALLSEDEFNDITIADGIQDLENHVKEMISLSSSINIPNELHIVKNQGESMYKKMWDVSHELKEYNGRYEYTMTWVTRSSTKNNPTLILDYIERNINLFLRDNPDMTNIKIDIGAGIGTPVNGTSVKWNFIHRISITFEIANTSSTSPQKIKNIALWWEYLTLTWDDNNGNLYSEQIYDKFHIDRIYNDNDLEKYTYVQSGNQQVYTHVYCSLDYDSTISPNKSPVKLQEWLINQMPSGIRYYEIVWNNKMAWSCIRFGKNVKSNYVTIQSDPDLFPIKNWNLFVKKYKKKYKKKPLMAFAWGRTWKDGNPEWLNITENSGVDENSGDPGSGFITMWEEGKFKIVKKSKITNGYWIVGFQERFPYCPSQWIHNTFDKMSNIKQPRRWIIWLSDGTYILWQSDKTRENMYTSIDGDSNKVKMTMPDGRVLTIEEVFSVESVGCGDVYIDGIWWASTNTVLSNAKFSGSLPESNVVVITDL